MKRLTTVVFLFVFISHADSQNKEFSRWSFAPEYGYNNFIADVNKDLTKINPSSLSDMTYGASLEYALTPIWGLSLDYYYFPLRAKANTPEVQISTNLYNSDVNATINFTRLIFPQTKSRFYFTGSVGIGYAFYTYNYTPSTIAGLGTSYNTAVSVPVFFTLEYNFSKPLAFGAKLNYRAYNEDNLEGVKALNYKGVTNDFIAAGTLFFRYKFHSVKKDHLRNIRMNTFSPDEGLVLARLNEARINKLDTSLNKLGAFVSRLDTSVSKIGNAVNRLDTAVSNLEKKVDFHISRLDSLYVILSNDGPDTDEDGVPDVRDLEPNTPPNTPVDFWGRTLKLPVSFSVNVQSGGYVPSGGNIQTGGYVPSGGNIPSGGYVPSLYEDVPAVYFDFDRFDLDDNALVEISKIAAKMKRQPDLFLEIRGYCDYSGKTPYNNGLSQRRSDRVKAELVKVWKIPASHINANGKGKVIEPRSKYRPNRRCDFFFGRL